MNQRIQQQEYAHENSCRPWYRAAKRTVIGLASTIWFSMWQWNCYFGLISESSRALTVEIPRQRRAVMMRRCKLTRQGDKAKNYCKLFWANLSFNFFNLNIVFLGGRFSGEHTGCNFSPEMCLIVSSHWFLAFFLERANVFSSYKPDSFSNTVTGLTRFEFSVLN